MPRARYVALLRGNQRRRQQHHRDEDLKATMEAHGLDNVSTYIRSGNVLFEDRPPRHSLWRARSRGAGEGVQGCRWWSWSDHTAN